MDNKLQPLVKPVPIEDLRPTQLTVGLREVEERRKRWRKRKSKKAARYLGEHMIPVIIGPKSRPYLIDNHHLARTLHDEGVKSILVLVIADLSRLDEDAFWFVMDNRGWLHPYDSRGQRCSHRELAPSVKGLKDDPFRSLAGELRRMGGYAKESIPFTEFLWADFLRRRIKRRLVQHDFEQALEIAYKLAKSPDADYLPGWCGPA